MSLNLSAVLFQTVLILVLFIGNESKIQNHQYASYFPNRSFRALQMPSNFKDKVSLKVYYETQCPGSIKFFKEQLAPSLERLGDLLDVYMIPYGHAKTDYENGRYTFECQHGDVECYGNMLHACAIDVARNNSKAALFNACLMERTNDYNTLNYLVNSCGQRYDIPATAIWENVNSRRGAQLLKGYGDETKALRPPYVPYVVLDGAVADSITTNHLGYFVCRLLNPRPSISGDDEKVDVRLYYECLCPYSIRFYTEEFNNTVAELAAYIEVKTYPYGNARMIEENGKTHVKCQHDEPECYGNKLHACAIDAIKDTTRYVSYISCMMSGNWGGYGSTDKDATKCGKLTGIDAKPIIECAKGEKGEKLLEHYGKETEKDVPNRLGVPWTLVNGKYTSDLKSTICAALKKPPSQCKA